MWAWNRFWLLPVFNHKDRCFFLFRHIANISSLSLFYKAAGIYWLSTRCSLISLLMIVVFSLLSEDYELIHEGCSNHFEIRSKGEKSTYFWVYPRCDGLFYSLVFCHKRQKFWEAVWLDCAVAVYKLSFLKAWQVFPFLINVHLLLQWQVHVIS